ncbi:Uncharacterised protein [Vibrio cholerae]|nr:Uncharacterised protein [Vibrio cholerae]
MVNAAGNTIAIAWVSLGSGGWPRPSLMWQFWQPLVLKRGPSPSRASVEAGAGTQGLRKKLLPTLKSRRFAIGKFAAGIENALAPSFVVLVSPPDLISVAKAKLLKALVSNNRDKDDFMTWFL